MLYGYHLTNDSVHQGFLEEESLSDHDRIECKLEMMKHRGDLSLVAAGELAILMRVSHPFAALSRRYCV